MARDRLQKRRKLNEASSGIIPAAKGKADPPQKTKSGEGRDTKGLSLDLPPMDNINRVFEDITSKAFTKLDFDAAIKFFDNRPVRVATMCSGTESPLLALGMISDALHSLFSKNLHFDHCFSGEIVPFKQAFIERNFSPKVLFRDIMELCEGEEGTTAYGQLVEIPSKVDLLVAGFSCVDFSNLNNSKKTLDEGGESGDTFKAIHRYIVQYRPALCILENIKGAPWEIITHIFQNDQEWLSTNAPETSHLLQQAEGSPGYAAKHVSVDSKNYYIPQTRVRGYVLLVDRRCPGADEMVVHWQTLMKSLERHASSSFEDFFMDKSDINLSRARADMTGGQGREVDWTLCRGRYAEYREQKQLGHKRPLTRWKNGGSCQVMDHWWRGWMVSQVERIFDTIEINYLFNAAFKKTDNRYKTRMIELSQNVDRAEDTNRPGIISCLTPTGSQFISSEGRPLTGREALALQGLPLHKLLLTRETQKEQLDLAGNAMTTTVVGAAIVAALIAAYSAIDFGDRAAKPPPEIPKLPEMDCGALTPHQNLDLDTYGVAIKTLKQKAAQSAALCMCEGQNQLTDQKISICKDCCRTSCRGCAGIPEHNYTEMILDSRLDPASFTELLKDALPMRLKLGGLENALEPCKINYGHLMSEDDWRVFREAILAVSKEEYQFYGATRSRQWTVRYDASRSYLEFIIHQDHMYWQVYGKPASEEPVNSKVRKLLGYPLAHLELSDGKDILTGQWALNLPVVRKFSLEIQGFGGLVPSWEAELGIQTEELKDKKVFKKLSIKPHGDVPFGNQDSLISEISGDYKLLSGCGTSFNSMHMQISAKDRPVYFWLDPERIGDPSKDGFSFSNYSYHAGTKQQRNELALISPSWRPSEDQPKNVGAVANGLRINCEAVLQTFSDPEASYIAIPKEELLISVTQDIIPSSSDKCSSRVIALLHIMVHRSGDGGLGNGTWSMPHQIDERHAVPSLAWLTERARKLDHFSTEWRPLNLPEIIDRCQKCAPKTPEIKWRKEGNKIIAVEDGQQAGAFERAVKARKSLFFISTWTGTRSSQINQFTDSDTILYTHFMVGLDFAALAHRVLAKFENVQNSLGLELSWRLHTNYTWPHTISFPKFSLKNNKKTLPAVFAFRNSDGGLRLRDDQLRSLRWMMDQELHSSEFREQEIVEEYLPQLKWLAEAIVKKPCLARGGLLADEVGYGKTATTLALIDQTRSEAANFAEVTREGTVSLKATLIIVPQTLTRQWENQIIKFLGRGYTVLVITDMMSFGNKSIRSFQNADIVLVASSIFKSPAYFKRFAEFAAIPMSPSSDKRAVRTWVDRASKAVASHLDQLRTSQESISTFHDVLQSKVKALEDGEGVLEDRPLGRLRGHFYAEKQDRRKPKVAASRSNTTDSFKLSACSSLEDIKGPFLQMFHFYRVVVDEYTYTEENEMSLIGSIQSNKRWILSGTPRLGDFSEVKTIANFLGVNLGIDDDAAIALQAHNIKKIRSSRTASEQFQAFSETRTPAWHMSRHKHAQIFLDYFVRQNTPEIGRILMEEQLRPIRLSGVERAIYVELEQQIHVHGITTPLNSTKHTMGDRIRRLKDILNPSKSPEESLLKRCSHFMPEKLTFVHARYLKLEEISHELIRTFQKAHLLQEDYDKLANQPKGSSFFAKWMNDLKVNISEDPDITAKLRGMLNYSQKNRHLSEEVIIHRDSRISKQIESEIQIQSDIANLIGNRDDDETKTLIVSFKKAMIAKIKGTTSRAKAPTTSKKATNKGKASNKVRNPKAAKTHPSGDSRDIWQESRDLTGYIRALQREFISRMRSFRYSLSVRKILYWDGGVGLPPICDNCLNRAIYPSTIFVLNLCGHLICYNCLGSEGDASNNEPDNAKCPVHNCNAAVEERHVHPVTALQSHPVRNPSSTTELNFQREEPYGTKFNAVIMLIKEEIPQDEQVLLFVQFQDLMVSMMQAFELHGIDFLAVLDSSADSAKIMHSFQDDDSESKSKVLMLNPLDESAAGVNLVNANHVIFISSMFANTLDEHNQAITQSIGRAKRFGQLKTVNVYTFLALNTIDVDILQDWKEKRLVQTRTATGDEKWVLKTKNEMSRIERKLDWGSLPGLKKEDAPEEKTGEVEENEDDGGGKVDGGVEKIDDAIEKMDMDETGDGDETMEDFVGGGNDSDVEMKLH